MNLYSLYTIFYHWSLFIDMWSQRPQQHYYFHWLSSNVRRSLFYAHLLIGFGNCVQYIIYIKVAFPATSHTIVICKKAKATLCSIGNYRIVCQFESIFVSQDWQTDRFRGVCHSITSIKTDHVLLIVTIVSDANMVCTNYRVHLTLLQLRLILTTGCSVTFLL